MKSHRIDQALARDLKRADPGGKVDLLFDFFRHRGGVHYEEEVTQLEHGLQAAALARSAGGTAGQITSALFHDLGHLLVDEPEGDLFAEDLNHEEMGAVFLEPFFPPEVTVPIGLHVPAKRYLCTVDRSYYDGLSAASKKSLEIQGGQMSPQERSEFETTPHLEFAVQLRRWDDGGKQPGWDVPDLESYREDVLASLV